MDIGPDEHFYGKAYPNRSGKGFTIIITVIFFLGWLILWGSAFNDFSFNGDIGWIYIKVFIGVFCLIFGVAGISSIRRN
jgi:hypothetical protein